MSTEQTSTRLVIPKARWAYVNVWEPRKNDDDDKESYSVCLIISKSDTQTIDRVRKATAAAIDENLSKVFGGKRPVPGSIRIPLRDGDIDRADKPEFAGCYFINAKSKFQPQVIDKSRNQILDHQAVFSGVYGAASITLYAYDHKGNKGVSAQLNNLMKIEDGERLSGNTITAVDEFADLVTSSDEADYMY